jgi:tRNA dimethylallyltransferase
MDIGTAKPGADILAEYPHHLVNILEPTAHYSVGDFRRDALALMTDITQRGKVPLLVGGTMLYFKALQQGLSTLPEANQPVRERLDQHVAQFGLRSLHQKLMAVDPISAKRIHENDHQRIQRALEVYELTGKSLTELTQIPTADLPYRVTKVILSPFDRSVLHNRIAQRYHQMIANGFVDEVKALYEHEACHANLPSIRAVGYRQVWQHLAGDYDLETCVEKAIIATRQMAKRQLTWLRAQDDATWFDTGKGMPIKQIKSLLADEIPELMN